MSTHKVDLFRPTPVGQTQDAALGDFHVEEQPEGDYSLLHSGPSLRDIVPGRKLISIVTGLIAFFHVRSLATPLPLHVSELGVDPKELLERQFSDIQTFLPDYVLDLSRIEYEVCIDALRDYQPTRKQLERFIEQIGLDDASAQDNASVRAIRDKYQSFFVDWYRSLHHAADRSGVSADYLIAMGVHESGGTHWNPDAISPTGCSGVFQLETRTARAFGIQATNHIPKSSEQLEYGSIRSAQGLIIDERRNPTKAVYAAADFIAELHGMFSKKHYPDDHLRMKLLTAAYNIGPGAVRKALALERSQGRSTYDVDEMKLSLHQAWTEILLDRRSDLDEVVAKRKAEAKIHEVFQHNRKVLSVLDRITA